MNLIQPLLMWRWYQRHLLHSDISDMSCGKSIAYLYHDSQSLVAIGTHIRLPSPHILHRNLHMFWGTLCAYWRWSCIDGHHFRMKRICQCILLGGKPHMNIVLPGYFRCLSHHYMKMAVSRNTLHLHYLIFGNYPIHLHSQSFCTCSLD